MKTKVTASSNSTKSSKFSQVAWSTIAGLLLLTAATIYILALTGDTTRLGDPYYEDQILAPQRAFAPWALTLVGGCAIVVVRFMIWWQEQQTKRKL